MEVENFTWKDCMKNQLAVNLVLQSEAPKSIDVSYSGYLRLSVSKLKGTRWHWFTSAGLASAHRVNTRKGANGKKSC